MLTDCPDPTEVTLFHFLQLRTLRISKENKSIPQESGNILAAASKYGLLFVGTEGGFKVINLESILMLDEDKENQSIAEEYVHYFVPSGTPVILCVNANQTTLAVCVKSATNVIINLYSLCTYSGSDSVWQPFCSNTLAPSGTEVRDFVWNPAVEGWYAVCFSDGSLQIHEVSGKTIKVIGTLQGSNTAVCWSPKGKQLVAGRENGSFTQYKPNLTEVQTVPPPGLEESLISVTSISWIANTLFAVVYVVRDTPNLFIVSTPKNSPCVYTNFYDVCLGNNCAPHQRYLLHLEPSWGIMVCASCDSIEVAVLGDMPNWVQWDLKEDGKALLPGKDGATHAIGMTVMYSAQRELVISESESYPPMPILFLLTNNGLLVSFHMINGNSTAPSLVSAPLPLENANSAGNVTGTPVVEAIPALLKQAPSTSNQSLMSATFTIGSQAAGDRSPVALNTEVTNMNVLQTFGKDETSCTLSVPEQKESSSLFGDGTSVKKPEGVTYSPVQKSTINNQLEISSLLSTMEKQNEVHSSTENSYMTAIISEIQSFVKELQDLKQLQSSVPVVDAEEDIVSLKTYALNLDNFQKNVLETMQSISSDIYTLKNMLLESFGMVEEACSRERRRNDHSYITLLKERALDPITAKRMQKMNQHFRYLETQMQEVSDKLDQDFINLYSNKKKSLKSNLGISSTQAIYKIIVNNRKSIHNLKKKVESLMKKSEERKLRNTTKNTSWGRYSKRAPQEDLSKLADEFLQVKIVHPEESEPTVTKKLSSESLTVLKAFLKQTNVITVRPTAVYSPSQSRLLSNAALSEDFSVSDHEKDITPKQMNVPTRGKEVPGLISSSSEAQISEATSKYSLSFEKTANQSAPITPVYGPITPPDVSPNVPVNKTFTDNNVYEKLPKQQGYQQPLFKGPNTLDSSVNTEQKISSNILSGTKSIIEGSPNVSHAIGGNKPLLFNQTSSEGVTSISTSLFSPQTLSFAANTQKVSESVASKPQIVSNNAMHSSAIPSFQFTSSFGPKKDIPFSIAPVNNSAASLTKIRSPLETKNASENVQLSQPEIFLTSLSTNTSNLPVGQSTGFSSPVAKTSQVSNVSLFIVPESKSSTPSALSGDKDQSSRSYENANVGIFIQKSLTNIDLPNLSAVTKDIISESVPVTAADEISVLNKTDSAVPKSSGSPAVSGHLSDVEKSVTALSTSISPNQTSFTTIQKTEDSLPASSHPAITKTFPNISDLKLFPSSEVTTSEPSVVSTAVTSAVVSETSQSTVPQPTNLSDMTKSHSTSNAGNVISQSDPTASKPSTPLTPVVSPVTTTSVPATTLFALNTVVSPSVNSESNADVTASKTESSTSSVIGVKSAPLFGQSSVEASSFFGTANTFNQTSVTQSTTPFGQTASVSNFPSPSGGFFSQVPNFGASSTATTTSSTDFNNQTSTFSFGKPTFGQTTGSFGLAKSFFGQNITPFTQAGASSTFSLSQNSSNVFGQGSFFSGLGGKPSEENASKNAFDLSSNVKLNTDTSNLFRNSSVTSFGAINSGSFSGTGSFSSGGGSVAQAGFGSFQQNTSPQPAGFVSTPSFGGAPTFGSPPAFGASPVFGPGNALSSSVFGQQQVSSNFSNFANANSPTFGSLASQGPGFTNSSTVGGFGSQGTTFGSSPVFGGSSFGQSSGFGSPGSPPGNSSAFTQWRN